MRLVFPKFRRIPWLNEPKCRVRFNMGQSNPIQELYYINECFIYEFEREKKNYGKSNLKRFLRTVKTAMAIE